MIERFPHIRDDKRSDPESLDTETYLARYHTLIQWWLTDYCTLCWQYIGGDDGAQIDHIIPWITGGCDHLHNARVVHAFCNRTKGDHLSGVRFHCPDCQFDALDCWNSYARRVGRIQRVTAWRRHHQFNRRVERPMFKRHQGQDALW